MRQHVSIALGRLGSEAAIPGLIQTLDDSNWRFKAVNLLENLESETAILGLIQALEHSKAEVRWLAAKALSNLGVEAAIPRLIQALDDSEEDVRSSAAEALGNLRADIAIPKLVQALDDFDSSVRSSAAKALSNLGAEAVIPRLIQALDDSEEDVCRSAVEALGNLGSETMIPRLIQRLDSPKAYLRSNVIEVLGNLGTEVAISVLLRAFTDEHEVRWRASQVLKKIKVPKVLIQLKQLRLTSFSDEIDETIASIQESCQFYNYELTQPAKQDQPKLTPTNPTIPPIDLAILAAIAPERQALCTALNITDNVCQGHGGAKRIRKANRTYWHTTLPLPNGQHYSLILAQAPDMANVDAALLAADTLNHWQPHAILMVGIAAATSRTQTLGDIILGKDIYYYDRGKVTPEGTLPEPVMYRPDATLWDRAITTPKTDFPIQPTRPDGTDTFPTITPGVIASGEKVIANADFRDALVAQHRKIKAIEMEGYGVHAAAHQRHQPTRCLVIRALCDYADGEKNDTWHPYAAAAAAGFTKHFLLDMPLEPRNN